MSEISAAPETHAARPRPWMTWSLCAVVVAIAIGIQLDGGDEAAVRWGWRPAIDVWRGRSWVLFTSPLVHLSLLHLAFNVYWAWILGRPVEAVLGRLRLAGFLVASALVSSAAQLAWGDEVGIGLSGVGYALFGFAWVLSTRRPDLGIKVSRQTVQLFGIWLLFGIFATYLGLVNFGNAAHLIGGIFGILAGLACVDRWKQRAVAAMGVLLTSAAVVAVVAPWSPTWNAARALSAYDQRDYPATIRWLDRSLRRGRDPVWVAESKARVHWLAGQKDDARADIDILRKLDPSRAEKLERQIEGQRP